MREIEGRQRMVSGQQSSGANYHATHLLSEIRFLRKSYEVRGLREIRSGIAWPIADSRVKLVWSEGCFSLKDGLSSESLHRLATGGFIG